VTAQPSPPHACLVNEQDHLFPIDLGAHPCLCCVRYKLYEDATFAALIDRYGNGSSSTCVQPQELPVVMVVGAGRGPIVRAALQVML